MNLVYLDGEITGQNPKQFWSLTMLDDQEKVLFDHLIKPVKYPYHEKWHHLVKKQKPLLYHENEIKEILDKCDYLIGFGINNDLKCLDMAHITVDKEKVIDILTIFENNFKLDAYTLKSCCQYIHYPNLNNFHDSKHDCLAIKFCFHHLLKLGLIKKQGQALFIKTYT